MNTSTNSPRTLPNTWAAFRQQASARADSSEEGYSTSELWATFLEEVARYMVTLRRLATALPRSPQAGHEIVHTAHTLKGMAGMMGFPHIAQLAHRLEDALAPTPNHVLLHDTIRVLEELVGGRRDVVSLQLSRTKAFASMTQRLRQTAQHAATLSGKEVTLTVDSGDSELELGLWDDVAEIMLHLVRNAVAHGIETPAQRQAEGKPPCGTIVVHATSANARLRIEVRDDGSGIDVEELRRKASVQQPQASTWDQEQLLALLWQSGFSTAPEVSELAGRGVGLDIVKTRVEERLGTLTLHTEMKRGTSVCLDLPIPT